MTRVRRLAGPIAAIWLMLQTATLIAIPFVFYAGSATAPIECTCVHDGNHGDCPMHQTSPAGDRVCFQTTDDTGLAPVGSLLGQVALVPGPPATLLLARPPLALRGEVRSPTLGTAPPEPPPPRA